MRRTAAAITALTLGCGGRLGPTDPIVDAGAPADAEVEAPMAPFDAATDASDASDVVEAGPTLTPLSVAIGDRFACAVLSDGAVWCWGDNEHGQLGISPGGKSLVPVRVAGVVGATRVTAGEAHACALLATGAVKCWGMGGRLGDGSNYDSPMPVPVSGLTGVATVASSFHHTCAVDGAGRTFCWGRNWSAALGDGTPYDHLEPVLASMPPVVKTVSTGSEHTCATTQNAEVWCWGTDEYLAAGSSSSSLPHPIPNVWATELAVGLDYSCGLQSGNVVCWGAIPGTFVKHWPPVAMPSPVSFKALAGSRTHACGLDPGGQAWCWGMGNAGQFGDSAATYLRQAPTAPATGLTGATAIACGWSSTCAIVAKRVTCWGGNNYGQLGDGTTIIRLAPVDVVGLP